MGDALVLIKLQSAVVVYVKPSGLKHRLCASAARPLFLDVILCCLHVAGACASCVALALAETLTTCASVCLTTWMLALARRSPQCTRLQLSLMPWTDQRSGSDGM